MNLKIAGTDKNAIAKFTDLYFKTTGCKTETTDSDDGKSDLVLIGSDATNIIVHKLVMSGKIDTLGIRTGTDDYRILSLNVDGQSILILAGGRTRADHYAVYAYFERFCGCRWFWDGDIIPKRDAIPLENIDVLKTFRFKYRGVRYFAHRSLHRFQAEHWSWTEWKNELDFLVKKQFNLFMLRMGQDDLFQKAFPDIVGYPVEGKRDPDYFERSYNDRTCFHGLRERARLRKKIMEYARKLDLIHPVDMGPMTHWYSRTPVDFLKKVKPELLTQNSLAYNENTGKVWDFEDEGNFENYWKLTEAEIKYYAPPNMFHMIGLAERNFGSERDNLQFKLYAYRRFIRKLRSLYPSAPLLIAGWDLMFKWKASEVHELLKGLDPENTLIFDYTSDLQMRNNDFVQWGVMHNFPYVFGVFQGTVSYHDANFDFDYCDRNLELVGDDPFCKGMVLWSESSHDNSRLHEYIAKRSAGEEFTLDGFCRDRYGLHAGAMAAIWRKLEREQAENSFRATGLAFANNFNLLAMLAELHSRITECAMREQYRMIADARPFIPGVYAELADIAENTNDQMLLRDIVDLARTHLMSDTLRVFSELMTAVWKWRLENAEKPSADRFVKFVTAMRDLLATHEDYSMNVSLESLKAIHELNPYSEMTLKGNSENSYCRSYTVELCEAIYIPEAEFYRVWLAKAKRGTRETKKEFLATEMKIRNRFYKMPLSRFRPYTRGTVSAVLRRIELL